MTGYDATLLLILLIATLAIFMWLNHDRDVRDGLYEPSWLLKQENERCAATFAVAAFARGLYALPGTQTKPISPEPQAKRVAKAKADRPASRPPKSAGRSAANSRRRPT